ncbi:MAG: ABC transporter permease, partial [Oscillospiraceae bacterium]|nr:ABC transporter permease [Oscillospiraceae bacterium]
HCDGLFPMTRTVRLLDYANTLSATEGGCIIISPELYRLLYGTKPSTVLIRSSDPATAKESAEHAITDDVRIQSREEYSAERVKDSRTMRLGLYAIIAAALLLTMIGISGNQLVGFESRRKEFALLHSTSMTRKQIARMIFLENGISFAISVLLSVIISIPVTLLVTNVFNSAGMGLSVTVRPLPILCFFGVIWVIIMLTARTPICRLRRMNTANEIKYE